MCLPGQPSPGAVPVPATAAEAVAMAEAGLGWLADADFTALTTSEQADCLRGLERAESRKTAAQARALSAFRASDGCRDDGHGSPRTWLRWKTQITARRRDRRDEVDAAPGRPPPRPRRPRRREDLDVVGAPDLRVDRQGPRRGP